MIEASLVHGSHARSCISFSMFYYEVSVIVPVVEGGRPEENTGDFSIFGVHKTVCTEGYIIRFIS